MYVTLHRKVDQANNVNDGTNSDNAMVTNNGVGGVALNPTTLLRCSYRGCHLMLLKCYNGNI